MTNINNHPFESQRTVGDWRRDVNHGFGKLRSSDTIFWCQVSGVGFQVGGVINARAET